MPNEPGLINKLLEGESGKFLNQLCEEICRREPDDSGVYDYQCNLPDGGSIVIGHTFAASAPSGAVN